MSREKILDVKNCDDCGMCCMIMAIRELNKPRNVWCQHCTTKVRCDIYETRPTECGTFNCGYISNSFLDERWKPNKSKIVLTEELGGRRVTAYVDPKRSDAWRKEPFYSTFKAWSKVALQQNRQVVVCVGDRNIVIFPDRDVDLGIVGEDHHVITLPQGSGVNAFVVHKDDPRVMLFMAQSWHKNS